jgi:hypothetical protein
MSGVKNLVMAENKGLKQPTNEDLKENGVASSSEQSEKYGEEKSK